MDIEKEEDRIKQAIKESKINWWNGLMIFSGLAITFLSTQNNQYWLPILLIVLYFTIASVSIFLIFQLKESYDYLQRNYLKWTTQEITEEQKRKDKEFAISKHKIMSKTEQILKPLTFFTIALTFVYIIYEFVIKRICN